jgi:uncharacterized protein
MDIETSGLYPRQHRLLTSAVLFDHNTTPFSAINLYAKEREALLATKEWLERADRVVTWAGQSFDLPFLNYRLRRFNEDRITLQDHFDLKVWCKRNDPFGLMASSDRFFHGLEAHANAAGIPAKASPLDDGIWGRADRDGDPDAFIHIMSHNIEDVISTRSLYQHLIEDIPNV